MSFALIPDVLAGAGPLSRPSAASPKGCLDGGPAPAYTSSGGRSGPPPALSVTHNFCYRALFSTLGVKPALGRLIQPSEGDTPGADPIIVLSYDYWNKRFAGDPAIAGTTVSIDSHPVTIVGVAPRGFYGMSLLATPQAYMPLGMAVSGGQAPDFMTNRAARLVFAGGRLRPGRTVSQAQSLLSIVAGRLSRQYADTDRDLAVQAYPELQARPVPQAGRLLAIVAALFLGLTSVVLLLACVNVANISLVRSSARGREIATRAALGAPRSRLIRQLLTESLMLALLGGAAGILFGFWGSSALASVNLHADLSFRPGLDWRVLIYALGITVVTGLIVGLAPAYSTIGGNFGSALRTAGRGVIGASQPLRSGLVAGQVGASMMLLVVAGLFLRSLDSAQRTNLGFDPAHVVNVSLDPKIIGYTPAQDREFYKRLADRIRQLPGVVSASTAASVPMGYVFEGDTLAIRGYQPPPGQPAPSVLYNVVSPGYFETMRIPLVSGRAFADSDDERAQRVAVINQAMAKRFWPGQEPVGREFAMSTDPKHPMQIVGIARDSRFLGVTADIGAYFFVPYLQHYEANSQQTLQVRTVDAPELLLPAIERTLGGMAPDLPVLNAETMTAALSTLAGLLIFQIAAALAAAFGVIGLILAATGVYGVVSYATNQRTREVGIRMALGAHRRDILRMVLRQGFTIAGVGLALGLGAAFLVARLVGRFLVISATDPLTYLTISATLTSAALLACYIPAYRATKVDPLRALRYE